MVTTGALVDLDSDDLEFIVTSIFDKFPDGLREDQLEPGDLLVRIQSKDLIRRLIIFAENFF